MKLNPDCIRDILLKCEAECTPRNSCEFHLREKFEYNGHEYSPDELEMHLRLCERESYIIKEIEDMSGCYEISELTMAAYDFLQTVRSNTTWKKILKKIQGATVLSIKVLAGIAKEVATSCLTQQIGLGD